jgi:hypothetical protein
MKFDKQQIVDLLKKRGEHDKAAQAESDLPDQVDSDQHADHLGKLGLNPSELASEVKGKLGL